MRNKLAGYLMHPPPGFQITGAVIVTGFLVLTIGRLVPAVAAVTPELKQSWLAIADISVAIGLFALTGMLFRIERQRDHPRFEVRNARIGFGGEDPSGGMSLFFQIANRGGVDSCLDEASLRVKAGALEFTPLLNDPNTDLLPLRTTSRDDAQHPLMVRVGHVEEFEAWFSNQDNVRLFEHRGKPVTFWGDAVGGGWVAPSTFTLAPGEPPSRSVIFHPEIPG